jgi:hypothetical protein
MPSSDGLLQGMPHSTDSTFAQDLDIRVLTITTGPQDIRLC